MDSLLFRHRGAVFAVVGILALITGSTPRAGLLLAGPWLAAGLGLRAWAFAHLGSGGRTRDPAPPRTRVTSGPYRYLQHPAYVGNLLIAFGLLVVARPPGPTAAGFALVVVVLYAILAARESRQIIGIPTRRAAALGTRGVLRSERSTWLSVGLFLLVAVV